MNDPIILPVGTDASLPEHKQMVRVLRSFTLRCRTGILLIPVPLLQDVPNIAARLGIDAEDYALRLRESLPAGTDFLGIDAATEESRMDAIASSPTGLDAVLVYNVDLVLARLDSAGRSQFWRGMRDRLSRRRRAVIIAMPITATRLLPGEDDLAIWQQDNRVASYSE